VVDDSQPHTRLSTRGRILASIAAIERHEMPAVVTSFLLFFCVFAGYFSVRPVRETVGTMLGEDRVADLWVANAIASLAIVLIYAWIVARVRRGVFLPWTYGSIAVALAAVGIVLRGNEQSVTTGQFFYVFISVLILFIVSVFWSFLLDLFDSGQAKRLFPVIAAGGTAGALTGPLFTDLTVNAVGNSGILFTGAALFGIAVILQRVLIALWRSGLATGPGGAAGPARPPDQGLGGNWWAGVTVVLRSPYLVAIAVYVMLLSTASTLLYFEQLRLVALTFTDSAERTRVFARLDWVVQSLTIVAQLFVTGRVAARRGLVVLLTMVPVAMIFGFFTLAVFNTFAVLTVVFVARRAGEYAFVRPGREMLWSVFDSETKYKAKNFVDVPVYRAADAAGAQAITALRGNDPQAIAVVGVVTALLWAVNGWWLGRRHDMAAEATRRAA
jgi:ATP:ADP antiporter, AAA family